MSKNNIIFKIDFGLKELFLKKIEKKKTNCSHVLRTFIKDYLCEGNKTLDIEFQKELEAYLAEENFKKNKEIYKRKLFCYYLINNTLKTIYKLSSSYLLNSGQLNMNIINKVIDGAEEVFNGYPEDIKNDLRPEFENLKLLKDERHLIEKIKILKFITMRKQMREIEEK